MIVSFGCDVSVMILLRILILSKIITLTSYLKLTIKTNIYVTVSAKTVLIGTFSITRKSDFFEVFKLLWFCCAGL